VLYDCPLRYAAELSFDISTTVRFIAAGTAVLLCSPSDALAASSGTGVLMSVRIQKNTLYKEVNVVC